MESESWKYDRDTGGIRDKRQRQKTRASEMTIASNTTQELVQRGDYSQKDD